MRAWPTTRSLAIAMASLTGAFTAAALVMQIHRDLVDSVAATMQPRAALLVLFPTGGARS